MKSLLTNWNFVRIIRLLLGAAILVQGIVGKDFISITFGVLFAGMAILNMGCCGTGCSVGARSENNTKE